VPTERQILDFAVNAPDLFKGKLGRVVTYQFLKIGFFKLRQWCIASFDDFQQDSTSMTRIGMFTLHNIAHY
jgi:hypothetical protein